MCDLLRFIGFIRFYLCFSLPGGGGRAPPPLTASPQSRGRRHRNSRETSPLSGRGGREAEGGVASARWAGPRCTLAPPPLFISPSPSRDVISRSLTPLRPPGPSSPPGRFQRRPPRPPSPPFPASPTPQKIPKPPRAALGALSPSPFPLVSRRGEPQRGSAPPGGAARPRCRRCLAPGRRLRG